MYRKWALHGPTTPTQQEPPMIVGQKYASSEIDTHYDAIVIGSGLGGLTTAALMAKAGKKVNA